MKRICYRKLRHYKYQLVDDYSIHLDLSLEKNIETKFLILRSTGEMTIKKSYAWDGPSGPTFDTKNFMRGSLVHDALYQLIREKHLEYKLRRFADELLKAHCLEDGMSGFRAWYVYKAVRWFGKNSALPQKDEGKLVFAPSQSTEENV